ncbi:MarR family winged helix-turn-helix transcriptional regulator [Roseibium salinum]|uniref:MarR family winged helix-turn-helix transcriptional regulator n=2 Tax=Roseibium salinum TaxID=1604349 RepID=A0ABT3QV84_9HYPH|nr:MarR family winged helix-turn-helix transcriptional regulator [Roseibium sp. DSM 29163]MCX2720839.1 MarR family winged helix-turn-helix transcriptional regulator [Roseibium sp. DSM 29163]
MDPMDEPVINANEPWDAQDDLPLNRFLTYRLSRVQAKLNAQSTRLLHRQAGLGVTQWRIIAHLGNADGPVRASEIKRFAAIDKGLFSRKLKELVEDDLVATGQDPHDQRVQKLHLTEKGRRLYESTLPVMQARQRSLRRQFDAEELRVLFTALDKLEEAAELTEFE